MKCNKCGACCIVPSITSKIPNMPNGKPAFVRCVNLDDNNLCVLYNTQTRPSVCIGFKPDPKICGKNFNEAYENLSKLELETMPKQN